MIEQDNIQELFSRTLENHTAPVRPEVWNGLQAKMAAAGVSSVAATKGVSLLAKWIIGSAAAATTAVVTTVAILNSNDEPQQPKAPTQEQISTPAVTDPSVAETTPLASVDNNEPTHLVLKPDGTDMYPVGPVPYVVNMDIPLLQERVVVSNDLPLVSATLVPKNTEPADVEVIGIPEASGNETTPADEVAPSTIVKNDEASIEFPNVFTPSVQDDANDEYFIKCKNIASIHVIIQNTENRLVYETTDLNFRWNGRINGTEDFVEKGTYACIAVYQDLNGKTHKKIILIDVR